jgi:hypothetical protein
MNAYFPLVYLDTGQEAVYPLQKDAFYKVAAQVQNIPPVLSQAMVTTGFDP